MLSNRTSTTTTTTNSTGNPNQHRRQWSEGVVSSSDKSTRFYKDDDRQLIQHLINEYLLGGSNEIFDLIRNCSNECFEALVDFIWFSSIQAQDSHEDDLVIYNQRSSLLSSSLSNAHRQNARRRFALIIIEIFKLLATQTSHGGRFEFQRHQRLISLPQQARQLINYEPDIAGLSCLTFASIILINPILIHHNLQIVFDALKHSANLFLKANLSSDTPSTFAVSIYSLFYLLYILYPNTLRRELQPDGIQPVTNVEKQTNRLGIEKVLLPLCYYFKLHPNFVCGTFENETKENRWSNESWQQLIANGERYVVSDEMSPLLSNDFRKRKDEDLKSSSKFSIDGIIRMCNDYAESVLHQNENRSQIDEETMRKVYGKKSSTDCYSNYSETFCQTYDQQWQTTIQNGQRNFSRAQNSDQSNRRHLTSTNGQGTKNGSSSDDHIHAKVQLQLNMLDCNYEQEKREYYAQLIRDAKKNIPIQDLDKELRNQELQYSEILNEREKASAPIHDISKRVNEFHQMNEAFYDSLSATRVELKTDEDSLWQQQMLLNEKHQKIHQEQIDLEQEKKTLENDLKDVQRRLLGPKQTNDMTNLMKNLSIEFVCARKKHQLLHQALTQLNLKKINADRLIVMHQTDGEISEELTNNLDEMKMKFQELKSMTEKKHSDLTTKRNHFHQQRIMNNQKINGLRRQLDSIRVCQTALITMNTNSQMNDD